MQKPAAYFIGILFLSLAGSQCTSDHSGEVGGAAGVAGAQDMFGTGGVSFTPGPGLNIGASGAGGMCSGTGCPAETGICGNSKIESSEFCDDGNAIPGDGCSGICRVEPNFTCPEPGVACMSTIICGDSMINAGEGCDDGGATPNDGCSASCQVEPGYGCSLPGQPCVMVTDARCGDGVINAGETCDDGGSLAGDGCSADCNLEPGYTCPTPGTLCELDEYCGNGKLSDVEQCDDGNTAPGDGCTGLCNKEPFYNCGVPGQPCVSTIVCGDSAVIGDEACDDGNTAAGDGCASDCKSTEPGYSCPTAQSVGGSCIPLLQPECGDGRLDFGEYCDDGNRTSVDGCTDQCRVTPGYTCAAAGRACTLIEWCGDGKLSLARGEQCDDGAKCNNGAACTRDADCASMGGGRCEARGGDGCAAICVTEENFACPEPGLPCVSTVVCGDGRVTGSETCDDRNTATQDGCDNCRVEAGWVCPVGGVCRATACGDGYKAGLEECDDGDNVDNGCSTTCQLRDGFKCPTPGQQCSRTTCGDRLVEGREQCDDGNFDTGDGCSPLCKDEPVCSNGACQAKCGDGIKLSNEDCDDGNLRNFDGCSSACRIELGFDCVVDHQPPQLPIVYRDFIGTLDTGLNDPYPGNTGPLHRDFEKYDDCIEQVRSQLDAQKKPELMSRNSSRRAGNCVESADTFRQWFRSDATVNRTVVDVLPFAAVNPSDPTSRDYVFEDLTFFPLDGRGFNDPNAPGGLKERARPADEGPPRNYHFTSELRYWFTYRGGEMLTFYGDDDVWVFINGNLAVDIAGVHGQRERSITLGTAQSGSTQGDTGTVGIFNAATLGLTVGGIYDVVVFQAERHLDASNYKLTLRNFFSGRSVCRSTCGDGRLASNEACDNGTNNDGRYNGCTNLCTLGPRCGDRTVQSGQGEQCDDGINLATYGGTVQRCGPGCHIAPYCGDGAIDGGEQCDDGAGNRSGDAYNGCSTSCVLGPRCGDGVVTNNEACDDGALNGTSQSGCEASCILKCGNSRLDAGEQCDSGTAQNTGGYGGCTNQCLLGPRCGDGVKQMPNGEQCDDGRNDGSYGTCAPMCLLGARCGDGTVQSGAGEQCDAGANNQSVATSYGQGNCTVSCRNSPYCGNRAVDGSFGETCDDGVNSGMPGSCSIDCKQAIPSEKCGNGALDVGEQCDMGASNGTANASCDARCRVKCGNGVKDAGEQCDNGVNDGSYGSCTSTCQFAGYCGDGAKNGPELCDLGANNQTNPYGAGLCTTSCQNAPKCGDGRIQVAFGEACDGGSGCTPGCTWVVLR